jgi:hypothetical protein
VGRYGDLLVVPAGGEHAITLMENTCPLVVVPNVPRMRTDREVQELTAAASH